MATSRPQADSGDRIDVPARPAIQETKASTEAIEGFDKFQETKDAMTPRGNGGLHEVEIEGLQKSGNKSTDATVQNAFVSADKGLASGLDPKSERGRKPESGENAGSESKAKDGSEASAQAAAEEETDPLEIQPENQDKFKTPVINPDDVMIKQFDGSKDRPRDEAGNISPESRKNFLAETKESVTSKMGSNGKLEGVVSQHGDEKTSFGFDKSGNVTRTIEGPDGKEVVQFDKEGKPVSRKTSENGGPLKPAKINPEDSVKVEKNPDGSTKITSTTEKAETTLELGKNGKPVERAIVSTADDDPDTITRFNEDGSVKENEVTHYDRDDHKTVETTRKDGKITEKYENGERYSTRDEGQDYTTTNETLPDGSRVNAVEDNKGSARIKIEGADGSTTTHWVGPGAKETKIENADGSSIHTYEDGQTMTYQSEDADGNWHKLHHNKMSGVNTHIFGDKNQKVETGTKRVTVPI